MKPIKIIRVKMHAATRKRRLVNRLIRKVNKLTAEAQYWRKRA